ncbi:hypothetical protein MMC21_007154 [Puttea exsequens]|nr:hypothetical protein [Puttea exsequens]
MQIINLGLRGLQFLLTLLILALTGNAVHERINGSPAVLNYVMFVAVFGLLSLFYLIAGTVNEAFAISPFFMVIADAINTFTFLIGGIALAAELRVHSCGDRNYVHGNSVLNGSPNPSKRCHEAQAVTAFLWFAFAAFAGSLVFSFLGSRGGSSSGGIRKVGLGRV